MSKLLKNISLMPKGLRYKLILAFSLMSIIPLLLCVILLNKYVFNQDAIIGNASLLIFITLFISILGFVVAKGIVDPVVQMAIKARRFVNGEEVEGLDLEREDEIGDLGISITKMASRLNRNVDTLKSYEERIRSINMEINHKVTALSTLFQISSIMSTAKDLNVILQTVTEKLPDVMDCEKSVVVMLDEKSQKMQVKATHNLNPEEIEAVERDVSKGLLSSLIKHKESSICDDEHKPDNIAKNLRKELNLTNMIIFPIILHNVVESVIILGNEQDKFNFKEDDLELMKVFGKQIAIAIENNWLMKKTEELSIRDELTGLFNVKYLKERLSEEIQRAITYQRPCSFLLFEVDDFEVYQNKFGSVASDEIIKKIAAILKANVAQIDKVARFDSYNFALILPEKNKREAHMVADKIRKKIDDFDFAHQKSMPNENLTVSVAVTANPIDGMSAEELISAAQELLEKAQTEDKNKVYT